MEQEASPLFDPAQPFGIVQEELDAVGERMRSSVGSNIPALEHAAGYLLKSNVQGKRLRPALMLMLATAMDECVPMRDRTQLDSRPPNEHPGHKRRCGGIFYPPYKNEQKNPSRTVCYTKK